MMLFVALLGLIFWLPCLLGSIWLLTIAFKKSVWWGLGVLAPVLHPWPPLVLLPIIFGIKYWKECKYALVVYIGGYALFCVLNLWFPLPHGSGGGARGY